jgi:hypothetical protein
MESIGPENTREIRSANGNEKLDPRPGIRVRQGKEETWMPMVH